MIGHSFLHGGPCLTALKYETPMFQEFRVQNRTHAHSITVLFSIWVYVYTLFFKIICFFPQSIDATQRFDFSIIAIKLFLVTILNLY